MTEEEYNKSLSIIRNEVFGAVKALNTLLEINIFASESRQNYDKLNRNAAFWNTVATGLRTSFIIGLGRIFDTSSDVHSIHALLTATVENHAFFAKRSLAERKRRTGQLQAEDLDRYLEDRWEPNRTELQTIKSSLDPAHSKYREKYHEIRNKWYAHNVIERPSPRDPLIADIDAILNDVYEVVAALYALFDNGVKHDIGIGYRVCAEEAKDRARSVLNRL